MSAQYEFEDNKPHFDRVNSEASAPVAVSPELSEFMHMLDAIEEQPLTTIGSADRN